MLADIAQRQRTDIALLKVQSDVRLPFVSFARQALPQARVHEGLIVSGDRFVSTQAESDALRSALPDALAVEMEGAAVAQVCADFGVPLAVVRTISDRADDHAALDFNRFVAEVTSRYSARLVQEVMDALGAGERAASG